MARSRSLPLHLAISEQLRSQIEAGDYAPGDQLPSEFDLSTQFGVSRTTVRRGIANLVNQGLVISQQGKGVFVKQQRKVNFPLSNPLTFFDTALARQGLSTSVQNIGFDRIRVPDAIAAELGLTEAGAEVYRRYQIMLADNQPIAVDIAYFPTIIGEKLRIELEGTFTYAALDGNGFPLVRANVTLEGTHATPELGNDLNTPLGTPLLVYCYIAYSAGGLPVVSGKTFSCADRTSYSVVLEKEAFS